MGGVVYQPRLVITSTTYPSPPRSYEPPVNARLFHSSEPPERFLDGLYGEPIEARVCCTNRRKFRSRGLIGPCGDDCFEFDRGKLAQAGLAATPVVTMFESGEDRDAQLITGVPAAAVQDVLLQQIEEDRQVPRACAGVEAAAPIAVAGVGALGTALAVAGPAQSVGLGAHQGVDQQGQQFSLNIRVGAGERTGQHGRQVDVVGSGHSVDSFARVTSTGLSKNHAMTSNHSGGTRR